MKRGMAASSAAGRRSAGVKEVQSREDSRPETNEHDHHAMMALPSARRCMWPPTVTYQNAPRMRGGSGTSRAAGEHLGQVARRELVRHVRGRRGDPTGQVPGYCARHCATRSPGRPVKCDKVRWDDYSGETVRIRGVPSQAL